jgi:hypothetical protein
VTLNEPLPETVWDDGFKVPTFPVLETVIVVLLGALT